MLEDIRNGNSDGDFQTFEIDCFKESPDEVSDRLWNMAFSDVWCVFEFGCVTVYDLLA